MIRSLESILANAFSENQSQVVSYETSQYATETYIQNLKNLCENRVEVTYCYTCLVGSYLCFICGKYTRFLISLKNKTIFLFAMFFEKFRLSIFQSCNNPLLLFWVYTFYQAKLSIFSHINTEYVLP